MPTNIKSSKPEPVLRSYKEFEDLYLTPELVKMLRANKKVGTRNENNEGQSSKLSEILDRQIKKVIIS